MNTKIKNSSIGRNTTLTYYDVTNYYFETMYGDDTEEHIKAHFLICFIALTIIRIIQYKILKYENKSTLNVDGWGQGITAEKIKEELNNFNADVVYDDYYKISPINNYIDLILKSNKIK